MKNLSFKKGFTLVEIMVVISIIGILSAVLYANFGEARLDAKNKAMKSELKETQLALELYKAQNGKYPPAKNVGISGCSTPSSGSTIFTSYSNSCLSNPYIEGVVPEFTSVLPSPTKSGNSSCNISYQVDTAGTWYKLTAENCHAGATSAADGVKQDDEFARCPSVCPSISSCVPSNAIFYNSYAVYSAGGECK